MIKINLVVYRTASLITGPTEGRIRFHDDIPVRRDQQFNRAERTLNIYISLRSRQRCFSQIQDSRPKRVVNLGTFKNRVQHNLMNTSKGNFRLNKPIYRHTLFQTFFSFVSIPPSDAGIFFF